MQNLSPLTPEQQLSVVEAFIRNYPDLIQVLPTQEHLPEYELELDILGALQAGCFISVPNPNGGFTELLQLGVWANIHASEDLYPVKPLETTHSPEDYVLLGTQVLPAHDTGNDDNSITFLPAYNQSIGTLPKDVIEQMQHMVYKAEPNFTPGEYTGATFS